MTIYLVHKELWKNGNKHTLIDKAFLDIEKAKGYIREEEIKIKLNSEAYFRQKIKQIVFKIKEIKVTE